MSLTEQIVTESAKALRKLGTDPTKGDKHKQAVLCQFYENSVDIHLLQCRLNCAYHCAAGNGGDGTSMVERELKELIKAAKQVKIHAKAGRWAEARECLMEALEMSSRNGGLQAYFKAVDSRGLDNMNKKWVNKSLELKKQCERLGDDPTHGSFAMGAIVAEVAEQRCWIIVAQCGVQMQEYSHTQKKEWVWVDSHLQIMRVCAKNASATAAIGDWRSVAIWLNYITAARDHCFPAPIMPYATDFESRVDDIKRALLFTKDLGEKVLSGRKTQTRRAGKRGFEVGELMYIKHGGYNVKRTASAGIIRVTAVRHERVCAISLDDAIKEGFDTVAEFDAAFAKINKKKNLTAESKWWVVDFELVETNPKYKEPE